MRARVATVAAVGGMALASLLVGVPSAFSQPIDPVELEGFVDGVMAAHLEELECAGAVVSIVQAGELRFAKGYGWADVEARRKVDPAETLFRIGSVSKLFVWTSVMQLVEEGRLDLDVDINEYLPDFDIPDTYDRPITLSHVMAHSAGFEDWVIGLFGRSEDDVKPPLGTTLAEQLPARVRPPGEVSSYSNHATGMAAYIVETVSGRPWAEFAQERILEPLGMHHTSFAQPLPEPLAAKLSKGYSKSGGEFEEQEFEWVPLAPVGAAASTAKDMAKFMIAHLQFGRFDDRRILREDTARRMQQEHFRMAPGVNPMRHGFMDMSLRGETIYGHGGNTFWFHTGLALFPEHDLGVFVSYNSAGASRGAVKFLELFVDHYFGAGDAEAIRPPADFADRAARFAGTYRANRFSHTTLAKLGVLFGTVNVEPSDDGELRALERRWIEVAPLTFRERDGHDRIVFREAEDGSITHFFLAEMPVFAFERAPASENPMLHLSLFLLGVSAIVGTLLAWPLGWAVRRWFGVRLPAEAGIPRAARGVLWLAALVMLAFLVGLVISVSDPTEVAKGMTASLRFTLVLPWAGLLVVGVSLVLAARLWWRGSGTRTGRAAYTLAALALGLLLWQSSVWNLFGGGV